MENPYANTTMLCRVVVTRWSASHSNRQIAAEVEGNKNAANRSAAVYNHLLKGDTLKAVMTAGDAAKGVFYRFTLPWLDTGPRLLPTKAFFDFKAAMRPVIDRHEDAVKVLKDNWFDLIEQDKVRLGDMFNEDVYPDPSTLDRRYTITTRFTPFPTHEDFRVTLGEEHEAEIREQMANEQNEAVTGAVRELLGRMELGVARMAETLGKENPRFRKTLVTNVQEIVELVPKLNVSEDQTIYDLCSRMQVALCHSAVTPENLREDEGLRKTTAGKASDILQDIQSHIGSLDEIFAEAA